MTLDAGIASRLKRDANGLFTAVAQERGTGQVLMVAPAAVPAAVLAKLEKTTLAALDTTTVRARLQTLGLVPIGRNSRETRANYDTNFPMQEKLIKSLGIRPD